MKVLFFGQIAEVTGKKEIEILGKVKAEDLLAQLKVQYPALKEKKFKLAVDRQIITDFSAEISEGAEVALLPPFAGG